MLIDELEVSTFFTLLKSLDSQKDGGPMGESNMTNHSSEVGCPMGGDLKWEWNLQGYVRETWSN